MKIFRLYKNKFFRIVLFSLVTLSFFSTLLSSSSSMVVASNSLNSLQQQYQQLENLINQNQSKINANNGAIANLNSQINTYQQLILQKQALISNEQTQINQLNAQIAQLNAQIAQEQSKILVIKGKINSNAKSGYEKTYVPPAEMFIGDPNINNALASVEYFNASIQHQNQLAQELVAVISKLNTNKNTVAINQRNATNLYNGLVTQQQALLADQNNLQTEKNTYASQNNGLSAQNAQTQAQMQNILAQIDRLSLQSGTPGIIGNAPCNVGAYYSQECPAWGNADLANTGYTYSNAGCSLIAAIIAENLIGNTGFNPYNVNSSQYWDSNGAIFNNFPGIQTESYGNTSSIDLINTYASPSTPVVVGLYTNDNQFGTHFVTMTGPLGATGTMQDPWFGPNLTFGQYMGGGITYSESGIFSAIVF
ncbi:MAG: murein hydrolase activator EnvC family protein [Patescibacteria group bacterium]